MSSRCATSTHSPEAQKLALRQAVCIACPTSFGDICPNTPMGSLVGNLLNSSVAMAHAESLHLTAKAPHVSLRPHGKVSRISECYIHDPVPAPQ